MLHRRADTQVCPYDMVVQFIGYLLHFVGLPTRAPYQGFTMGTLTLTGDITSMKRKLLRLTQDIVFKAFFSRNKQVLVSLLKAFLPIPNEVSDVVILNPEEKANDLSLKDPSLLPDTPDRKRVVLDLNIKLASGENINVEMQSAFERHFLDRVLLYWARLHGQGLKRGDDYAMVNPTYSLIFTDFPVFGKKEVPSYMNEIILQLISHPKVALGLGLRIVIVELNKLNKSCAELIDLREQ